MIVTVFDTNVYLDLVSEKSIDEVNRQIYLEQFFTDFKSDVHHLRITNPQGRVN